MIHGPQDNSENASCASSQGGAADGSAQGGGSSHHRSTSVSSVSSLVSDTDESFVDDLRSPGTANNRGITFRYSLSTVYPTASALQVRSHAPRDVFPFPPLVTDFASHSKI